MAAVEHPGVRRSRLAWPSPVRLHDGERSLPAELVDISLTGARIRRPEDWRPAERLPLRLELLDPATVPLRLAVRVVRESPGELALRFEALGRDDEAALAELLARRGALSGGLD
jgi:hypothetical protein